MTTPPMGDDSQRALAAAFAFLDDYVPPADDLLGQGTAQAAQDSLFLQENELSALLDAQSSDLSGWTTGDQFFGPSGGGDPATRSMPQLGEHAPNSSASYAPGPLVSPMAPPLPPPATTKNAASVANTAKKARNYNPNRARDEQRKELARLREQVPRLEQVLARLKWKARRSKRAGPRTLTTRSDNAWQEVAACRRELREQAELENARLRTIVKRQIEIVKRMQQILQTRHRYQGTADRLCFDSSTTDTAIFERLLEGVARSFSEMDAVFVAYGILERSGSMWAHGEAAAASIPFEITVRRVAALDRSEGSDGQVTSWRYFARSIENMPWRAYQRQQEDNAASDEPTVVESCGVKLYAAGADCNGDHVCQYIRKTKEDGRIVIAWGSFADNDSCKRDQPSEAASLFRGVVTNSDAEFYTSRCPHSDRCFQRHQASARSDLDAVLQPDSMWGMLTTHCDGETHREVHGESLEVTAHKVMPFDVRSTGDAAWQYFAHALEHVNYRFYYKKDAENLDVAEDTIVEGFRLELLANGRQRARFRVHQVLRKVERSGARVVLVWRATMQPLEFGGQAVRGACYHEKGYVEIRRAPGGEADAALVQTCYLITPRWRPEASLTARDRRELTDTVLSSTAANITASYQMIESALVDAAVRCLQRRA